MYIKQCHPLLKDKTPVYSVQKPSELILPLCEQYWCWQRPYIDLSISYSLHTVQHVSSRSGICSVISPLFLCLIVLAGCMDRGNYISMLQNQHRIKICSEVLYFKIALLKLLLTFAFMIAVEFYLQIKNGYYFSKQFHNSLKILNFE